MTFFNMQTILHFGTKLACHRPGTKYCVDLSEHFGTSPLEVIFTSDLRPNLFPMVLCLCQCSRLPVRDRLLLLGEHRVSMSGMLLGALAALSALSVAAAAAAAAAEDALLSRWRWQWMAAAVACSARRWQRPCAIKLSSGRTVIQRWRW